jgi:hypothetical protein
MVTAAARSRNTDNLRVRFQEGRIFYSQDEKFPSSASPSMYASLTFPLHFQIQINSIAPFPLPSYHEDSMSLCSYCTLDTPVIHAAIIRLHIRPKFHFQVHTVGPKSEVQGPLDSYEEIFEFLESLSSPISSLISAKSRRRTEDRGQKTDTERHSYRQL